MPPESGYFYENVLKVKYCEMNNESNLHIANRHTIHRIFKKRSIFAKMPLILRLSQAVEI
jgi:hypothetical protein